MSVSIINPFNTVTPSWLTTYSNASNANVLAQSTLDARQHLAASLFSFSGSKFRLSLTASSITEGVHISEIHAGHAATSGDAYDFDGTQVQVLVSGASSFLVAVGTTVVTDENIYTFDKSKAFIVAMHFDSAANDSVGSHAFVSGGTYYFKVTAAETGTTNVTGYSNVANTCRVLTKIEVWG